MYPTFLPISGQIVVYLCLLLASHVQYIATREVPQLSSDTIVVPIDNILRDPTIDGVKCVSY